MTSQTYFYTSLLDFSSYHNTSLFDSSYPDILVYIPLAIAILLLGMNISDLLNPAKEEHKEKVKDKE